MATILLDAILANPSFLHFLLTYFKSAFLLQLKLIKSSLMRFFLHLEFLPNYFINHDLLDLLTLLVALKI